jgi:hypothetical protein
MTDEGGELPVTPAWEASLLDFRRELERRGSSRHTLEPTGGDLVELAEWATAPGKEPGSLAYRDLRSTPRRCPSAGLARASVARKLAAVRSFHDHLDAHRTAAAEPAELLPMPKKESRLPRVLAPDDIAALLDRIPASGPLEVRDRAMLESPMRAACAPRRSSTSTTIHRLRLRGPARDRKGPKTRIVPMGEPASARSGAVPAPGSPRARERPRRAGAVPLAPWAEARHRRTSPQARPLGARGGRRRACVATHAPPLLRDASARGGRRFALDPGTFGPLSVSTTRSTRAWSRTR